MQSKLTRRAPAVNERYKSKKRCFEDTRDHHAPIESRIAQTTRARVQIELPKDLATLARCPLREMRVSPERQKKAPFRRKNRERQHSTSASVPRLREPRVPRNAVASRYTKTVEFDAPSFIRDSGRHDGSSVTRILFVWKCGRRTFLSQKRPHLIP